jgi:hypothetical protein
MITFEFEGKPYRGKVTKMETNINWEAQSAVQRIRVTPVDENGDRIEHIPESILDLRIDMYQYLDANGDLIPEENLVRNSEGVVTNGVAEYAYFDQIVSPMINPVIYATLEARQQLILDRFVQRIYNRTI